MFKSKTNMATPIFQDQSFKQAHIFFDNDQYGALQMFE